MHEYNQLQGKLFDITVKINKVEDEIEALESRLSEGETGD